MKSDNNSLYGKKNKYYKFFYWYFLNKIEFEKY